MKTVSIDRAKRLRDEPHTGHNRWHPDLPPILRVSNDVDLPNVTVALLLPEAIFQG